MSCACAAIGASRSAAAAIVFVLFIASPCDDDSADSNLLRFAPPMHFADKALVAEITARMLLEVKAVLFYEAKPFIFTSGWASPVYIDCRKLIFYPRIRSQLVDFATVTLARDAGFEQFDVVAGGETAGIPYAAWIAERLGLPMQYVGKKTQGCRPHPQHE